MPTSIKTVRFDQSTDSESLTGGFIRWDFPGTLKSCRHHGSGGSDPSVRGSDVARVVDRGPAGSPPGGLTLDDTQWELWRAGHAHAGVWVILSLVLQVLLDAATLSSNGRWTARVSAPVAALAVSGGFFGLAFCPAFRWLVYAGGLLLVLSLLLTGVGLLRGT